MVSGRNLVLQLALQFSNFDLLKEEEALELPGFYCLDLVLVLEKLDMSPCILIAEGFVLTFASFRLGLSWWRIGLRDFIPG